MTKKKLSPKTKFPTKFLDFGKLFQGEYYQYIKEWY